MLRRDLDANGLSLDPRTAPDDVVCAYLNFARRVPATAPRSVYRSREFQCPADLMPALATLEGLISSGENITPYLSKLVLKPNWDAMLDDFGISHFHLGSTLESDGKFIKRTGPLLFANLQPAMSRR